MLQVLLLTERGFKFATGWTDSCLWVLLASAYDCLFILLIGLKYLYSIFQPKVHRSSNKKLKYKVYASVFKYQRNNIKTASEQSITCMSVLSGMYLFSSNVKVFFHASLWTKYIFLYCLFWQPVDSAGCGMCIVGRESNYRHPFPLCTLCSWWSHVHYNKNL